MASTVLPCNMEKVVANGYNPDGREKRGEWIPAHSRGWLHLSWFIIHH